MRTNSGLGSPIHPKLPFYGRSAPLPRPLRPPPPLPQAPSLGHGLPQARLSFAIFTTLFREIWARFHPTQISLRTKFRRVPNEILTWGKPRGLAASPSAPPQPHPRNRPASRPCPPPPPNRTLKSAGLAASPSAAAQPQPQIRRTRGLALRRRPAATPDPPDSRPRLHTPLATAPPNRPDSRPRLW